MKKVSNKLKLIVSSSIATALVSTPFIFAIDSSINIEARNNLKADKGFNIETIQTLPENEILFGQFNETSNIANATNFELQQPYENRGLSSSNSKTLINNEKFTMNFFAPSASEPEQVIIKSLLSANTVPKPIPTGTPIGGKGVVSAQLIGSRLWLIIDESLINEPADYKLRLITLDNVETDNPTASTSSNHTVPIDYLYTPYVSGEPEQSLVLAPIYETVGNRTSIVKDEIAIYQQNEKIANDGTKKTITISKTDKGGWPSLDNKFQMSIPEDPKARLMSTFIYKKSPLLEYDFGIYHSQGSDKDSKIAYSTFPNNSTTPTNTRTLKNIGDLNNLDFKNQMSYPKVVVTGLGDSLDRGFESFWIYPTSTGLNASKVFSTSLDNKRQLKEVQPEVLDLKVGEQKKEIALISYQNNGNFDAGNLYIPVKYKNPNTPNSSMPGIINWKSTTDPLYWSNGAMGDGVFDSIILPFNIDPSFPNFNKPNEAIHSAIIQNIDVLNEEITYLFNYIDGTKPGKFYKQTRSLKQGNLLGLVYNSDTPQQIVTNIGKDGIAKYSMDTNETEIIPRIKDVSKDYLSSSTKKTFEIVGGKLNFNPDGSLTPQVKNINGSYIDGAFNANSKEMKLTLIQQPEIGFIPLSINIDNARNAFKSSADFANKINEGGFTIGDTNESDIKITSAYLPTLKNISAFGNDFTGVVDLTFEFISSDIDRNNPNGIIKSINLSLSGFAASQTIIAIVVPITLVVIGIILALTIFLLMKKKKKDMFVALKAGMSLKEQMSGKTNVSSHMIKSSINNSSPKKVPIGKQGVSTKKLSQVPLPTKTKVPPPMKIPSKNKIK